MTRDSSESVAGATLLMSGLNGCTQPLNTSCWPAAWEKCQPGYAGFSTLENFFPDKTMASGGKQNERPISTFDRTNLGVRPPFHYPIGAFPVQNPCQSSSSGPTRTGRRFEPYVTSRARENEQRNSEPILSTPAPPHNSHVGPPTLQPTEGVAPETVADAGEEDTVIKFYGTHIPNVADRSIRRQRSKRTRLPNGSGRPRKARAQEQKDTRELCDLVRRWKELAGVPATKEALAREYISRKATQRT